MKERKEDRKETWQSEWTNYTAYRVLAGLNEYCRRYPEEAPLLAASSSSPSSSYFSIEPPFVLVSTVETRYGEVRFGEQTKLI